jgi:hypothetical protein
MSDLTATGRRLAKVLPLLGATSPARSPRRRPWLDAMARRELRATHLAAREAILERGRLAGEAGG